MKRGRIHTLSRMPEGRIKQGVYTRGLKTFSVWHAREAHNIRHAFEFFFSIETRSVLVLFSFNDVLLILEHLARKTFDTRRHIPKCSPLPVSIRRFADSFDTRAIRRVVYFTLPAVNQTFSLPRPPFLSNVETDGVTTLYQPPLAHRVVRISTHHVTWT